ncbi:hypothetical protein NIES4072_46890 [Nostoc commune NIES-4072]|uniref:Uncharacterized protein n=1 Tax=Nostoc commune NIES-4072 TaxID=2005467 RepID=A0A2R5FQH4_NOSCO|nr:hypothetical protein NIES4070_43940 [Nostoc commune HK-02]GBG21007.1 hypothetical protein NIES4072_46890 [Nostoc commune NIES-4072]
MVEVVKTDEQKKKKPDRRPKLIIEDQVLTNFGGLSPQQDRQHVLMPKSKSPSQNVIANCVSGAGR